MKKKLLTVALAATMVVSSALNAFAADTITGGWWTAWTPGYEVNDTVEFDIEVKGGDNNYNNVSAVFVNAATTGTKAPAEEVGETYKEYAVVRADSWGWGGGDNKSVDGNAIEYTTDIVDADADGDTWDDFVAIMKDAHIDATITKTATGIELKYAVTGANGASFNYTATTAVDTSAGLYVFFACDTSEVTVAKVEAPAADNNAGSTDNNAGSADNNAGSTDNNAGSTDNNAGSTNNNAGSTTTPATGDATTVGLLLAVAAVSVVVVLKRRTVAE